MLASVLVISKFFQLDELVGNEVVNEEGILLIMYKHMAEQLDTGFSGNTHCYNNGYTSSHLIQ